MVHTNTTLYKVNTVDQEIFDDENRKHIPNISDIFILKLINSAYRSGQIWQLLHTSDAPQAPLYSLVDIFTLIADGHVQSI